MDTDRITVFKGGALGDFLLAFPVLAALRARFPRSRFRLVTAPKRSFLADRFGAEVLDSGGREWAGLFDPCAPSAQLRKLLGQEDLLIAISESPLAPFPYLKPAARAISVPSFPPPGGRVHVTDFLFQRLREAGLSLPVPSVFSLQSSALSPVPTSDFPIPASDFFVLHPSSGSPRKNWPGERFAALARALEKGRGLAPVVLGGEADCEALGELGRRLKREGTVFVENAPLKEAAAVLARAALYVGNDSGMTHLAALLGVPTVALFGATDPRVWSPRGRRVEIVAGTAPCAPCEPEERRRCPDNICLKSIPLEEVIARTKALIP